MGVVIGQEAPPDRRFAITAPTPCWPVLEALACGTPAVVPSGGVARELVSAAGTGPPPDRTGAAWRLAPRPPARSSRPRGRRACRCPSRRPAAGVVTDGPRSGWPTGCGRCWTCRPRTGQFPWSATVDGLLAAHGATRALAG
jgi:hypothetical protein